MHLKIVQIKTDLRQEINSLAKVRAGISKYYVDNTEKFVSNIIIAGHDPTHLLAVQLLQKVRLPYTELCTCENEAATIGLTLALIPEFQDDFTLGANTTQAEKSRITYLLKRKNPQRPISELLAIFQEAGIAGRCFENSQEAEQLQTLYTEHKNWYSSLEEKFIFEASY